MNEEVNVREFTRRVYSYLKKPGVYRITNRGVCVVEVEVRKEDGYEDWADEVGQ